MKRCTVSFTASILVLSGLCVELAAQSNFGSNAGQSQNTGSQTSGSQTTSSNFGSSNTPFGGLVSGGQQAQSGTPFSGSTMQSGIFGGTTGNLLGAATMTNLFTQGQNQGGGGAAQFGGNQFGGGFNNFGMGGLGRGGNLGNRNNQRLRGGGGNSQIVYRTQLTLGFNYPQTTDTRLTQRLERQLDHPQLRPVGGASPQVAMVATDQGTVAVLRGTVATQEDRLLAEQIALLDPGISAVRNELMVNSGQAPPAPRPLELPAPASDTGSPR
jgi:hypothetical protein